MCRNPMPGSKSFWVQSHTCSCRHPGSPFQKSSLNPMVPRGTASSLGLSKGLWLSLHCTFPRRSPQPFVAGPWLFPAAPTCCWVTSARGALPPTPTPTPRETRRPGCLLWPTVTAALQARAHGNRGAVPGGLAFLSSQETRSPAQGSHLD